MLGKCFHCERKANLELKALRCRLVGTDFGSAWSSWTQRSLQSHGHDWASNTKLGNLRAKKWRCPFGHSARNAQEPKDTSVMCAVGVCGKPSCPGFRKRHTENAASASTLQWKLRALLWPSRAGFLTWNIPAPPVSAQPAQGGSLPFCDLLFSFLACVWLVCTSWYSIPLKKQKPVWSHPVPLCQIPHHSAVLGWVLQLAEQLGGSVFTGRPSKWDRAVMAGLNGEGDRPGLGFGISLVVYSV